MSATLPQLEFSEGLAIGYTTPLARTEEAITLGSGTHFLLARNGRGKTTLLRTVARTRRTLSGRVGVQGRMQYLPEDLRFDEELPVHAIFRALIPRHRLDDARSMAGHIELDLKKPYGKLSTGNRRKTALIVAEYTMDPTAANILLLDEPFSGLDAYAREAFERLWEIDERTLRLVSCHPDYDSMRMPSALIIQEGRLSHSRDAAQTWSQLKPRLN